MPDFFEILELAPSLTLTREEIEDSWRRLSREAHPDVSGDRGEEELLSRLNEARDALVRPAGILSAWLRVHGLEEGGRNAAIGEELMTLFTRIGPTLEEADNVVGKIRAARTNLAKSLLSAPAMKVQQEVQARLSEIGKVTEDLVSRFPELERSGPDAALPGALEILASLKFLEKWSRECQQRLLALISAD